MAQIKKVFFVQCGYGKFERYDYILIICCNHRNEVYQMAQNYMREKIHFGRVFALPDDYNLDRLTILKPQNLKR